MTLLDLVPLPSTHAQLVGITAPVPDGLRFTVVGVPVPQGSMKAFVRGKRAFITSDNTKLRPWRQDVKAEASLALRAMGWPSPCFQLAVGVEVTFWLPRPLSAPKRVTKPRKKPDADKLVRALFDALTGVVWIDDAQVVEVTARKRYAPDARPRCDVAVWSLGE